MRMLGWIALIAFTVVWIPAFLFVSFVIAMSDGKVLNMDRLSGPLWTASGYLSVPHAVWAVLVINPVLIFGLGYLVSKLLSRNKVP